MGSCGPKFSTNFESLGFCTVLLISIFSLGIQLFPPPYMGWQKGSSSCAAVILGKDRPINI